MSKFTDHYSILCVNVDATITEIISAYKRQCFKYHPDLNPGMEATKRMQEINEARRILSHTELRETYNKEYWAYKRKSANQSNNKGENSKGKNANPKASYSFNLKSDIELIHTCANAAKYKLEYIHAVLQELKKRNYTLSNIQDMVLNQRGEKENTIQI